jgi:ApbE superfamily uncharacterized protein (UPF0280 family)
MTTNELRTQAGLQVKHEKKLENKNALKHGLFTKDAKARWRESEEAIREVRQTLRKIAEVNPELRLSFETTYAEDADNEALNK